MNPNTLQYLKVQILLSLYNYLIKIQSFVAIRRNLHILIQDLYKREVFLCLDIVTIDVIVMALTVFEIIDVTMTLAIFAMIDATMTLTVFTIIDVTMSLAVVDTIADAMMSLTGTDAIDTILAVEAGNLYGLSFGQSIT